MQKGVLSKGAVGSERETAGFPWRKRAGGRSRLASDLHPSPSGSAGRFQSRRQMVVGLCLERLCSHCAASARVCRGSWLELDSRHSQCCSHLAALSTRLMPASTGAAEPVGQSSARPMRLKRHPGLLLRRSCPLARADEGGRGRADGQCARRGSLPGWPSQPDYTGTCRQPHSPSRSTHPASPCSPPSLAVVIHAPSVYARGDDVLAARVGPCYGT